MTDTQPTEPEPPAGPGDPLPALTAALDVIERAARAAMRDADGGRWYHTGPGEHVHAAPYGNPVAVGPHGCGLFDAGTHIALHDPRAALALCRQMRNLTRLYEPLAFHVDGPLAPAAPGYTTGYAAGLRDALRALTTGLAPAAPADDEDQADDE